MKKEIRIEIQDDGSLKLDSRGVPGSADEVRDLLEEMAKTVGGKLTVEKHIHGLHTRHENRSRLRGRH